MAGDPRLEAVRQLLELQDALDTLEARRGHVDDCHVSSTISLLTSRGSRLQVKRKPSAFEDCAREREDTAAFFERVAREPGAAREIWIEKARIVRECARIVREFVRGEYA